MKLNLNKIDIDRLDEELPTTQKIKSKTETEDEVSLVKKKKLNKTKRGKNDIF